MCAVLQVCKLLGNNGSKSHELNNVEMVFLKEKIS